MAHRLDKTNGRKSSRQTADSELQKRIVRCARMGMLLDNYLYVNLFPQLPFLIAIATTIPTLIIVSFLVHGPTKGEN